MFVAALKKSGSSCAYTGNRINDCLCLSEANVGFAMGANCNAVTQSHSDIALLDANFASVKNAAKWGRYIFFNARKFIQFQLTVNITCLMLVLFSVSTVGWSPFNVTQLLWINLILDVFAAIALATEPPHPTELRKERLKQKETLITTVMWR